MEVQVRDIRKHFGPVKANDGITLSVPAGTIQGILGENGAGKSTLMKILSGFQPADSGRDRARRQGRRPCALPPTPSGTASACCTRTRSTSRP